MKGFIEVESGNGIEIINVAHIIGACESQIRISAICDDGYTRHSIIVHTKHTYEEIKQKIAEAIDNE